MYTMRNRFGSICKWLLFVKNTLNNLGLSNIWLSQGSDTNIMWFKNCIKQKLNDQGQQNWQESVCGSGKCDSYKIFKESLCYEKYLDVLPSKLCIEFTKFRCCNNKFPIEIGSYSNIPRNQRICSLCNDNQMGDGYHYLLVCSHFNSERNSFLKNYYYCNPSVYKFAQLLNVTGTELINVCKFISYLLKTVQ